MKNFLKSLASLALIVFSSCVNELTEGVVNPTEKTKLTIGFAETKTSLGDLENGSRKVYWSDGNKICVNGVASSSIELSEDKRSATFEFDGKLEYPYSVLYPAEMYKDAQTITLPAVQAAANNTFADDAAPMAVYQETEGKTSLHHLTGVVRLQVKLPAENPHSIHSLNRVEFRGNAGEQVSGDFTIDYESLTLTGASSAGADKVVVTKAGKTLSTKENKDVFIVVPAIRYEQGFTVRLIDAGGHYMDIKSKDITIVAGEIKAMPVVEFVPTGTLVGVSITSAADLVTFAKAYNAGEYADEENIYVRFTNDIVFDDETSAAWEPIGTASTYFRGTFDGENYSIKNWISTKPLFYATYADGYIENVKIDATCQVNIDLSYGSNVGTLVAYHRGTLRNCHNNATLTVSGEGTSDLYAGGLVGRMRVDSKVENCSMSGDVIADANLSVAGLIDLGGLVGYTQEDEAVISGSEFNGNLTFAGAISSDKYAYIGGIIGRSKATVKDCSTSADKNIIVESSENKVSRFLLGGIAGSAEANGLVDCTNNSLLSVKYLRAKGTGYVYLGGVTGYLSASASLKGCRNTNNVFSYSDAKNAYVAGVVGLARAESVVDDCHNESTAEISAKSLGSGSYGARYLDLGGVIGRSETSKVSNISNAGKVNMNRSESHASSVVYVGGCIGALTAALDGNNTVTNSGAVTAADDAELRARLAIGGVVGTIDGDNATLLSNVANTGNVTDAVTVSHTNVFTGGVVGRVGSSATIQGATNSGAVSFSNSAALVHVNTALGGIVGGTLAEKVCVIKNSVNDGKVSTVSISKVAGSGMVCGGIAGIVKGAGSSVQECTNNGVVQISGINNSYYDGSNDPSNSKSAWTAGGIVGFGAGVSDSRIRITDCINKAECYGARGYVGGVAGYVRYANIEKSHHQSASRVRGANSSVRVGGITGYLESSTIADCSVTGVVDGTSYAFTGGVSAGMNATSVISSSIVNAKVTNSGSNGTVGAIVSYSETGSVIRDCSASGQIGIGSNLVNITTSDFDPSGNATIEFTTKKLRVGVIGDSISTFSGVIPSAYKAYYPKGDVDMWTKTYWSLLINEYWNAELDLNCSYSGSRVAPISGYDSDFLARCETFINPDIVLLHGGTNDYASEYVELGEFDFTSSVDNLNTFARFRESYVAVIKKIQAKYPDALIICIIGDYAKGDYGESVKTIAEHFDLPYVDFRGDSKVTKCSGSHPDSAGMAHMAARIYEETKAQVENIKSK